MSHNDHHSRLQRWLPCLRWPRPSAALLRSELIAGFTVALLMVPQSVAYAALAGMPLITGLYAGILPAMVGVLWGGTPRLSIGPTALTCLLIHSSLAGMAAPASTEWVQAAMWLALLSGLIQASLGFLRYGWLLNLISSPVMLGFSQAAALLILWSQLPALLGLLHPKDGLLAGLSAGIDPLALSFGAISLLALWWLRRLWPHFPGIMGVVIGAGLISHFTGFASAGGSVIGDLPSGLPQLVLPDWPGLTQIGQLLVPAMVISLVSFLETASSAKTEHQQDGTLWNENQDLIGQGLAKIASALSGSFPTSSSFSRSAIFLHVGAKSGWAVLGSAIFMVPAVLAASLMQPIPQSVLAAIVIITVLNLIKPQRLWRLWRIDRVEALTALATLGITLLTAPAIYWGVLAGVLLTLTHFLHTRLHPRIIEIGLHPDGSMRDRHLWKLPPWAPHVLTLRMDAELDFAAASSLERAITDHLARHPDVRDVCLLAQPINRIDITGIETFGQIRRQLAAQGITLHISGIKLPVQTALERAGEWPEHPLLKTYRTDAEAMAAIQGRASGQ